jgi:hypothetical protein
MRVIFFSSLDLEREVEEKKKRKKKDEIKDDDGHL